jgi:hypothetical protein
MVVYASVLSRKYFRVLHRFAGQTVLAVEDELVRAVVKADCPEVAQEGVTKDIHIAIVILKRDGRKGTARDNQRCY